MTYRRYAVTMMALTVLLVLLALACLVFGSVDIPVVRIVDILSGKGSGNKNGQCFFHKFLLLNYMYSATNLAQMKHFDSVCRYKVVDLESQIACYQAIKYFCPV